VTELKDEQSFAKRRLKGEVKNGKKISAQGCRKFEVKESLGNSYNNVLGKLNIQNLISILTSL
jgi:hypothetical protein